MGGEESCGATSPNMKEDDKSAKPDAVRERCEMRRGGGETEGGRRNSRAKLTGLDMVTYWEFVLVEAEYNNITYIALSFQLLPASK